MNDSNNMAFEQRLRDLLAKTENVDIPTLSAERMKNLRALITEQMPSTPLLKYVWEKIGEKTLKTLSQVYASGLITVEALSPTTRGEHDTPRLGTVAMPLPHGELRVQVVPFENRKAKLLLSVKGYSVDQDLSVELSLGPRLIEARSMEQTAEFSLNNIGHFSIVVYSGDEPIGSLNLDIGEEEDLENDR